MNKERLLKLADLLHDHSRGYKMSIPGDGTPDFDLSTWINDKADCGTAACAVGCAMLSPEFQALGLKTGKMPSLGGRMQPVPKYKGALNWAAVEKFFGVSNKDAEHLFSDYEYPDEDFTPTPKQVAKRIRKFVAEHV